MGVEKYKLNAADLGKIQIRQLKWYGQLLRIQLLTEMDRSCIQNGGR